MRIESGTLEQAPPPARPPVTFAAVGLNHSHIYGQVETVLKHGGELAAVYAKEPDLLAAFTKRYPQAKVARSEQEILDDTAIQLVVSAGIPNERAPLGIRVMQAGKDFMVDKPGITTLAQLAEVRRVQAQTRRIYSIIYGGRLESPATQRAVELVHGGAIGQVLHTMGTGPHRIGANRPDWFWNKDQFGGVIADLGTHQVDYFVALTRATRAEVVASQAGNLASSATGQSFEDFGDAMLRSPSGSGYFRVDWFTPAGVATFGDSRLTIMGTDGYIEVRPNVDLAGRPGGGHLFLVDQKETRYIDARRTPLPYGATVPGRHRQPHRDRDDAGARVPRRATRARGTGQGHQSRPPDVAPFRERSHAHDHDLSLVAPSWPPRARAPRSPPSPASRPRSSPPRSSARRRPPTASTSAPSAWGASRATTTCPRRSCSTRRASWPCAISIVVASRTASASSTTSTRSSRARAYDGVTMYDDYRELLANKDIDAVLISTPDHWHAPIAIAAVEAGKDVYLQKPASLTIAEGRALSYAVQRTGRVLQLGSQNRSLPQHRYACELVRNGRIGQLKTVEVGLAADPGGEVEPEMPVPAHFNYDMWLGSTPHVFYTEKRVHPQVGYDRPGWLRCEQFGAGMITGWGAHHIDTAHWGMGAEHTGPVEIWGTAEFPGSGLWDVHGAFRTEARYADGVHMIVSDSIQNGVKFIGTEGWIFVNRVSGLTGTDPKAFVGNPRALDASDRTILTSVIGARRDPPDRQQGSARQLARGDSHPRAADRPRRSRPPLLFGVPAASHGHAGGAHPPLGSRARAIQERRRGQRLAVAAPAASVRHVRDGCLAEAGSAGAEGLEGLRLSRWRNDAGRRGAERRPRIDRRNGAQELVDRFELAVRHLAVHRPRHD